MYAAVSRRAGTRNLSYAASTWGEALNASALKHQKCSCSKQRTRLMATYACPSAKNCARTARAAGQGGSRGSRLARGGAGTQRESLGGRRRAS
eukprot:7382251-Prymnesium_polylepis.1